MTAALLTRMRGARGLRVPRVVAAACAWPRVLSTAASIDGAKSPPPPEEGFIMRLFGPSTAVASDSFTNRWAIMVPAFTTHLCLGGPGFGWSVISSAIVREHGFVSAASTDWSLFQATMPMPLLFTFLGLAGATFGKWQSRVGERMAIGAGGLIFGGGMLLGGLGVYTHNIWLVNLGVGVLGGTGVGLAYTPPVQALMQWFPDKRGLAMGTLVAGFGAGGLAFVPAMSAAMDYFSKPPTYLGPMGSVETTTRDGVLYATTASGDVVAAVQATSADLAKISGDLAEGLYAVGSGSTGAAEALAVCGALYLATMSACALTICRPRAGWLPDGYKPPIATGDTPSLSVDQVMRTPQFYQLGTTFACITTGIYGIFSVAKGMMSEVFSGALPGLVTAGFTSSYLMMLSVGNLSGRFGMATLSDRIGCKNTFNGIILILLPIYFSAPMLVQQVVSTKSALPLYAFIGSTWVAVFAACGSISTTPAYEASLFGTRNVGAVHGRMLVFNSIAAITGPNLFVSLRTRDELAAINDLLCKVDPQVFHATFGVPVSEAEPLIKAKTVTVSKIMALMPAGTPDPTPFLYDSTMYTMGGLALVSAIMHNLIRPVDVSKFPQEPGTTPAAAVPAAPAATPKPQPETLAAQSQAQALVEDSKPLGDDAGPLRDDVKPLGAEEKPMSVHDGGAKTLKD